MNEFIKGIDLIYIIGILSAIIGGIWAFYRFVYEKKLEKFKEANAELFSDNKQKVLTAIATLGVYKKDWMFEKNTIDVLISKLYTETDYDITNALGNALIQFSNRRELFYIANEILDINRNFYIQEKPYKDMADDLDNYDAKYLNEQSNSYLVPKSKFDSALRQPLFTDLEKKYKELKEKNIYQLTWLKQITADTYGRIIRRAYNLNLGFREIFIEHFKRFLINWDFRRYTKNVDMRLYQNAFAYIQMAQFKTKKCEIVRSTLAGGIIADIKFDNIIRIFDTEFSSTSFYNCVFSNGIISQCMFQSVHFANTKFININFDDIFFINCYFYNCEFIKCKGLEVNHFYKPDFDGTITLPNNITTNNINSTNTTESTLSVFKSDLRLTDKLKIASIMLAEKKDAELISTLLEFKLKKYEIEDLIKKLNHNINLLHLISSYKEGLLTEDTLTIVLSTRNDYDILAEYAKLILLQPTPSNIDILLKLYPNGNNKVYWETIVKNSKLDIADEQYYLSLINSAFFENKEA
ncbi:MAG: hypothetical protein H7Y00_05465 [Fimbriimonadaceae bacterium]|nr:hypothetical protein [Chitinophagales bacterium]